MLQVGGGVHDIYGGETKVDRDEDDVGGEDGEGGVDGLDEGGVDGVGEGGVDGLDEGDVDGVGEGGEDDKTHDI